MTQQIKTREILSFAMKMASVRQKISRYVWNRGGAFQPYAGVKLGAEYAQLKSTFNVFEANKDTWGFYVSPEIGFNVYPWAYGPGLHFAAYYSYGTNKGDLFTYSVDGLSNFGLRVGIAF